VTFSLISPVTFGGGYAMIPLLEKRVTEKNKWIKKEDIVDILAICQTVPGSIAVNTASFIGFKVAGVPGAVIATLGIIAPSFLIVLLMAVVFLGFQDHPIVQAAFTGFRPAIAALILFAAIRTGKSAIFDKVTIAIAIVSYILLLFVSIHPIFVLLFGGVVGILFGLREKKNQAGSYQDEVIEDRRGNLVRGEKNS